MFNVSGQQVHWSLQPAGPACKVRFLRENRTVEVEKGANLRAAAMKAGIEIYPGLYKYVNCHGHAQCASCIVHLRNGTAKNASPRTVRERLREAVGFYHLGHEEEARLACQVRVTGDLDVWTQPAFNWFGE